MMSETKHTPGPWTVVNDETVTVRDTNDGCVASMGFLTDRSAGPRRSRSEVNANARLIAAAPDMLAALKRQQENIARWLATGVPADAAESKSIADEIYVAIAKAEGQ